MHLFIRDSCHFRQARYIDRLEVEWDSGGSSVPCTSIKGSADAGLRKLGRLMRMRRVKRDGLGRGESWGESNNGNTSGDEVDMHVGGM